MQNVNCLGLDGSFRRQKSGDAHRLTSHRLRPPSPVPTARQPFSGVTPEVHLTSLRRPRARAFESATLPVGLRLRYHSYHTRRARTIRKLSSRNMWMAWISLDIFDVAQPMMKITRGRR